MPLEQFSILLDSPSGIYFPGQLITGLVVIRAKSEEKCEGLHLKFKLTPPTVTSWGHDLTMKNGTGEPYKFHWVQKFLFGSLCRFFEKQLLGDDGQRSIPCGESEYPFTFQVPLIDDPSSSVGQRGKVEYKLEAVLMRGAGKFDYRASEYISVRPLVDLNLNNNMISGPGSPGEWKTSKIVGCFCWCCTCSCTEPLGMIVRTNSKGYCPGEIMKLVVEISNLSCGTVTDLSAKFVQKATLHAGGKKKGYFRSSVETKRGHGINPGKRDIWRHEIQIPSIPPGRLGGRKVMDLRYKLQVTAHISGVYSNLKLSCPIIVGTIPRTKQESSPPQLSSPSASKDKMAASKTLIPSSIPVPDEDVFNFNFS